MLLFCVCPPVAREELTSTITESQNRKHGTTTPHRNARDKSQITHVIVVLVVLLFGHWMVQTSHTAKYVCLCCVCLGSHFFCLCHTCHAAAPPYQQPVSLFVCLSVCLFSCLLVRLATRLSFCWRLRASSGAGDSEKSVYPFLYV